MPFLLNHGVLVLGYIDFCFALFVLFYREKERPYAQIHGEDSKAQIKAITGVTVEKDIIS